MPSRRVRTVAARAGALALAAQLALATPVAGTQDEDLLEALGDVALFVETETLVAGAARRVAKLSEAPGTITVIDGEDLRARGVLTLAEAIRYVSSVTFAPGAISATTRIRDIEQSFSNKVLLLVDGRIVNGVFRGNFFVDLSQPIDNVARVEVVRGPGSALYGANAFAGFINVVTRRGDELEGVEYRATVGTDSLFHGSVLAGGRRGAHDWTAEARFARADGLDPVNPDSPNADHQDAHVAFHWGRGDSQGEDWFARFSLTETDGGVPGEFSLPTPEDRLEERRPSLDAFRLWRPGPSTQLKLRGYFNRQDNLYAFRRVATDLTPLGDQLIRMTPRRAFDEELEPLDPTVETLPNPDSEPDEGCTLCDQVAIGVVLDPAGGPPRGGSADDYHAIREEGPPQVTDRIDSDEWQGFVELQADYRISRSNYLLGGVSARVDSLDNDIVGSRRFQNYALFVEDEQRFLDEELILLGSLRLDDHSFFGLAVSPRVSLIWSPNRKLILKGAFGKAFRSPNFVELFGDQRAGTARIFGQRRAVETGVLPRSFQRCLEEDESGACLREETIHTELEQEEIESYELWTEYRPTERLKFILNVYQFEIDNEVGVAFDRNDVYFFAEGAAARTILGGGPPFRTFFALPELRDQTTLGVFLNAPERTSGKGAELELLAEPADWLELRFAYSWRDSRKAEVRRFIEADDASAEQVLVPTFGVRSFHADQLSGELDFRPRNPFWASLRFRLLGRPDESITSGGGSLSTDLTLGMRSGRWTGAATALNLIEGGTVHDPGLDDLVGGRREFRLSFSYRHEF